MTETERREGPHDADELLEAIEEANDLLYDAAGSAEKSAERGGVRPTTIVAFKKLSKAHHLLSEYDRTITEEENPE